MDYEIVHARFVSYSDLGVKCFNELAAHEMFHGNLVFRCKLLQDNYEVFKDG